MNIFDLIVYIVLVYALWRGWQQGCVVQLCGLAGVVLAVWLAARFGPAVGAWCGVDAAVAAPAGFVVVLLAVLILVAVAGRIVRKVLHFAGLGVADVLLGIALSVVKYALLLSVFFTAFARLNDDFRFVEPQQIYGSRTFRPLQQAADRIFPMVRELCSEASEHFSQQPDDRGQPLGEEAKIDWQIALFSEKIRF